MFTLPTLNMTSDMIIPPGIEAYDYVNVCPSTCTSKIFPPEGVKVLNTHLHMHTHATGGAIEVCEITIFKKESDG
jgi:hypothetical protein